MRKLILILMLIASCSAVGQVYTEFYIDNATGDNLFSGHTPTATATYGTTACNWTNDTSATIGTIYKSGLGAVATAVTNGAFASIFPDGTTGATPFVGMVVTNDATQDIIQISLVNKGGTKPASSVAGTSINVGGAWKGPGTWDGLAGHPETNMFPFCIFSGMMTNRPLAMPCYNIKAGTTYSITNQLTVATVGPFMISGYGSTPRDGTPATIDGGVVYPGFILLAITKGHVTVSDMIFANNGASGSASGVENTGGDAVFRRCVFHDLRGKGVLCNTVGGSLFDECEAYACNKNGSANYGAIDGRCGYAVMKNCISHDNIGSANCHGYYGSQATFINCVAFNNSGNGFNLTDTTGIGPNILVNCECYSNALAGVDIKGAAPVGMFILNCNFTRNRGMGVTNTANTCVSGSIMNCGFGSGTETNVSGNISANVTSSVYTNSLTIYAADQSPWTAAASGNFNIVLAAAKSAGRSRWILYQTNSPTIGYPDIGAAQASDTNSAGGEHSHVFAQ